MATSILPAAEFYSNADDKQVELFCLIWLDGNVNARMVRNTEQKLRSIINHFEKFQDVRECQRYIEQRSRKDRLVLIVSGQMGKEIVPSIHQFRQVASIYVYCMDKTSHEEWSSKFRKVRGVIVDLDELLSQIQTDHRIQKNVEEPLPFNFFAAGKATTGINGQFIFSQVLIDCLLRLKFTPTDEKELIDCCKKECKGNDVELSNLRDFEQNYSPDKALWWYSRESFLYKTLNTALRTENIHMIFLFRAFISDIYRQLQKYQAKKSLQVYRCQMISGAELKTLKQCIGQFISVNSFFSTSVNRWKAFSFLDVPDTSDDLERVSFEIEADPNKARTKPFADIRKFSDHPDEVEVLFMLGSIFRLQSIDRNDDKEVWIIRMTLYSDDEHDLKQVFTHMKEQIGNGDTDLRTFGNLLREMGKFDLAQTYFIRFLKQLPLDDPLRMSLYEDLAKVTSQSGELDISIQWRQKLLTFKEKNQLTDNVNISKTKPSMERQISVLSEMVINTKWKQHGMTIAGGNGDGNGLNQFSSPYALYVNEDDQRIDIADWGNNRIVEWNSVTKNSQVVAGGNGPGNRMNQLNRPTGVIVDQKTDSFIVSDRENRRVVRWSHRNGTNGVTIISGIDCWGLTMDNNGDLYISDWKKNEVRRWKIGETKGTIVAGGNGEGNQCHQLYYPTCLFVDEDQSVYISDNGNHRVMKWLKGAKEGIVVAGGQGQGKSLTQLSSPQGVTVDQWGHLYVADCGNDRIMRWLKGSKKSSIVVGGNGIGNQSNQFKSPRDLFFDKQGQLYVVDSNNHRVQKFDVDEN